MSAPLGLFCLDGRGGGDVRWLFKDAPGPAEPGASVLPVGRGRRHRGRGGEGREGGTGRRSVTLR